VIALLVLLAAQACPPGVDPAACGAQDACVQRLYRPRPADVGVTDTEASLVARLDAEHACALVGWGHAVSSSVALALARPTPLCPEPLIATAVECECGTLSVAALTGLGACALCGGAAIGAGAYLCRGGP